MKVGSYQNVLMDNALEQVQTATTFANKSGEAGRGFAVVADEVRKLAEKTMASTNDVGNAIAAIQQSTSKSVQSMDNALEQVQTATTYANKSGEALREIVNNALSTADQVRAIATASEEQSASSEEINKSILEVNERSEQTAHAMAARPAADAPVAQAKTSRAKRSRSSAAKSQRPARTTPATTRDDMAVSMTET